MPTMADGRSTLERLCKAEAAANADATAAELNEYEEDEETEEAYGSAKRKAPPLDESEGGQQGRV